MALKRRPTQERLVQLEQAVAEARANLAKAQRIASIAEHPGWPDVQELVQAKLDAAERRLDDFEKLTPEQRGFELKERQVLRMFSRIVMDFEAAIPAMNEAIGARVAELADYKARLEKTGG